MESVGSCDSDEGLERSMIVNGIEASGKKIFHDLIHPHMELPDICYRIINTPQFQRLRNLKQLGVCYYVYPSAAHNRFEHCIGTSYLAGKYCRSLQKNQPELGIDSVDILCLEIAGLCHDLGHGPFSHTWEHFMKCYIPDYSHEVMSTKILDYMIEENGLWELMEAEGLKAIDLRFIKELILGHSLPGSEEFHGRGTEKWFLYQIVSNEDTKIDVDKFDYLLRDCKQLNVSTAFDYERVIDNSRVIPVREGDRVLMKIAYRKKIADSLEDLFKGRLRMHQMAYQHKVIKIIEEMILDGLKAAEPHFLVLAQDGEYYKLSDAYQDLSAFMKLTDGILELVVNCWVSGGPEAHGIFNNIIKRNLYKSFGYMTSMPDPQLWSQLLTLQPNFLVISTAFNYGKGNQNPLSSALFYEKSSPNQALKLDFSPSPLEAKYYIVYRPPQQSEPSFPSSPSWLDMVGLTETLNTWAGVHGIRIHLE